MGLLGALFKPFKKLVKKIGKKVKKVFKKIGKAIGKLGIVGQIGMMFLMPYAAGALGSFFGATGKLASWGTTLLKGSGIASKALGHTLNAINTVGTMAGKVYTGVTDTISNAFNTVINKGREGLTRMGIGKGVNVPTDVLGGKLPEAPSLYGDKPVTLMDTLKATQPDVLVGGENFAENLYKGYQKSLSQTVPKATSIGSPVGSELISTIGSKGAPTALLERSPVGAELISKGIQARTPAEDAILGEYGDVVLNAAQKEKTLIGKAQAFIKENVEQGWTDAKKQAGEKLQAMVTDPVGEITDQVTGKVKDAATTKLMETIGLEEPTQEEQAGSFNSPAVVSQIQTDSGINFTNSYAIDAFAKQGNNHLAYGLANTGHVASIFDPQNNPTTNQFMTSYYLAPNVSRQLGVV